MSTPRRRLEALEQLAEDIRLREQEEVIRTLAGERGIPFEQLWERFRECQARTTEMRRRGLADAQIEEAAAQRIGCPVETLRARRDELIERFAR